jgi:hypothetical protein
VSVRFLRADAACVTENTASWHAKSRCAGQVARSLRFEARHLLSLKA